MRLLVIGGTIFVGRHIVGAARAAGHDVTLFHRGRGDDDPYADLEHVHADRDGGLDAVGGRTFDAVVDTSGYVPRVVRASVARFREVAHYTFVSTISVYASFEHAPLHEDAPLAALDDPNLEQVTDESYGALKVACEEVVRDELGVRALIVRPGLIVGPFDPTDRFTYWPRRIARGGEVLAPGDPHAPTQFIDARDLASWVVRCAETQTTGTINAVGPRVAMGEVLDTCRSELNGDTRLTWVDEAFLRAHNVKPWTGLPLWIPAGDAPGVTNVDNARAVSCGLAFRALAETVRDTARWDAAQPARPARAGLSLQEEANLLRVWHAAADQPDAS